MHLEADYPYTEDFEKQEAEFILVADRSSSMQGNPWSQVQSAILKMLDLTKAGGVKTHIVQYNHEADFVGHLWVPGVSTMMIRSLRASGSTSFVAAFDMLMGFFKDRQGEKKPKSYFVLFLTDGVDTCNSKEAIMVAKEHLQVKKKIYLTHWCRGGRGNKNPPI